MKACGQDRVAVIILSLYFFQMLVCLFVQVYMYVCAQFYVQFGSYICLLLFLLKSSCKTAYLPSLLFQPTAELSLKHSCKVLEDPVSFLSVFARSLCSLLKKHPLCPFHTSVCVCPCPCFSTFVCKVKCVIFDISGNKQNCKNNVCFQTDFPDISTTTSSPKLQAYLNLTPLIQPAVECWTTQTNKKSCERTTVLNLLQEPKNGLLVAVSARMGGSPRSPYKQETPLVCNVFR